MCGDVTVKNGVWSWVENGIGGNVATEKGTGCGGNGVEDDAGNGGSGGVVDIGEMLIK